MHLISLWIGKTIFILLKLLGRRGAALPGKVVESIDKKFLQHMLGKLSDGVIVVSGTNGKTTSTKLLTAIFKGDGKKVLTNPTGSNFTRGVIATIVQHSSWTGHLDFDVAVIELDEAYAAKFVDQHKPKISLVLNVMRDQMDRFGEIDHTAKLLTKVVANTTGTVVLNRDDARVRKMSESANCDVEYFGVSDELRDIFRNDDELHGKIAKVKQKAICQLQKIGDEKLTTLVYGKDREIPISLYGLYNAQNVCAVIATALAAGLDIESITKSVSKVKPAFGRGERILVGDKKVILQLVKNPGGFRHALLGAANIGESANIIAINDDYADGRDVSWLWDVDFNVMVNKKIITSGTRAADMALRLRYDDIKTQKVEQNLKGALDYALNDCPINGVVHIYTTYTAMLKLRNIIGKKVQVDEV